MLMRMRQITDTVTRHAMQVVANLVQNIGQIYLTGVRRPGKHPIDVNAVVLNLKRSQILFCMCLYSICLEARGVIS